MSNLGGLPTRDGKMVVLVWEEDGSEAVHIPIAAREVGKFAMGVLDQANKCAAISGERVKLSDQESPPDASRYVVAHEVGLSEAADRPDLFVLSFAIGATAVSIGIRKEHLPLLGQNLLVESADERAPH